VKGPPRQQNQLATAVNLWQISGKSASTGTAVSVESPRTRLPATCFRGAASGNRRCAPPHPGPTHYELAAT
jgi:hypothetical protein